MKEVKKKFQNYYDDSSSEEDEADTFAAYGIRSEHMTGLKKTRVNIRALEAGHGEELPNTSVLSDHDIAMCFDIHDLAVQLVKSPQVGKKYFPLKDKFLNDNKLPSIDQIKILIKASLAKACTHFTVEPKELIDKYVNKLVENPRNILRIIQRADVEALYPYDNPLELKSIRTTKVTRADLLKELNNVYRDAGSKQSFRCEDSLATRKVPKKDYALVQDYELIYYYKATTPLAKLLRTKLLLKCTTGMKVGSFLEKIITPQEIQCAINTDVHRFRSFLLQDVQNSLQLLNQQHTERATLSKGFFYKINNGYEDFNGDRDNVQDLIALSRLMTISIKRYHANVQTQGSEIGISQKSFFRQITFAGVEVLEQQVLYANGTRSDQVEIETVKKSTYKDIYSTIKKLKQKLNINDRTIVSWIRDILRGTAEKNWFEQKSLSNNSKQEIIDFIAQLTYLLFGTESARNPANLMIHQMMLDLIRGGKMSFESVFTHQEGGQEISGGKMPMSMQRGNVGAVDIARLMHEIFETATFYSYDRTPAKAAFTRTPEVFKVFVEVLKAEAEIIGQWYKLCEGDVQQYGEYEQKERLILMCQKWYGITPMIDVVLNELPYGENQNPFYQEMEELEISDLLELKKLFSENQDAATKLCRLKECKIKLSGVLKIYKMGQEVFKCLSSELVSEIILEAVCAIEDIIDAFALGMSVDLFYEMYQDESDHEHCKFDDLITNGDFITLVEQELLSYKDLSDKYDDAVEELGGLYDDQGDSRSDEILNYIEKHLSGDM